MGAGGAGGKAAAACCRESGLFVLEPLEQDPLRKGEAPTGREAGQVTRLPPLGFWGSVGTSKAHRPSRGKPPVGA